MGGREDADWGGPAALVFEMDLLGDPPLGAHGHDPTKMILSFLIGVGAFPGPHFVDEENRVAQGRTQIRSS